MSSTPQPASKRLLEHMTQLLQRIEVAREEITALRPGQVRDVHLPAAGDELDAIKSATESATQTILDAAERISATAGSLGEPGGKINEQVMRIFEACTFQDITGQRVTKVFSALKEIELTVSGLVRVVGALHGREIKAAPAVAPPAPEGERSLLHGPQLPGQQSSQADIDALFDSLPTASNKP